MTDQSTTPTPIANYLEAPASWNTKYLDPSGFECQITLRDTSGANLLKKASAALLALVNAGCTPVAYKPAANGNGNGKAQEQPDMMVCELHNAEMKKHEKDGQAWYSHKLADGTYCKGKATK